MSTKIALVTGAAKRLGRDIALHLARNGWAIALHFGRSKAEADATRAEILALSVPCELFQADLSDPAAAEGLVPRVIAAMGTLDAIVNSASRFEHDRPEFVGIDSLRGHFLPNLAAPVILSKHLFAHCQLRQSQGVVINMLDQKLSALNPDFFSYTLSKAALQTATTMIAQACAPHLRAVGIAPGLTLISHLQSEQDFARTQALSPLGRSSQAQDIADSVLFCLNNKAITGTTLVVDGGQHLLPQARDFSFL